MASDLDQMAMIGGLTGLTKRLHAASDIEEVVTISLAVVIDEVHTKTWPPRG